MTMTSAARKRIAARREVSNVHTHNWVFSDYCGVKICADLECLQHYDLIMCYCGWANDLAVGAMGEDSHLDDDSILERWGESEDAAYV